MSDKDLIRETISHYIKGAISGKGDDMKPAFHNEATIFGYIGDDLFCVRSLTAVRPRTVIRRWRLPPGRCVEDRDARGVSLVGRTSDVLSALIQMAPMVVGPRGGRQRLWSQDAAGIHIDRVKDNQEVYVRGTRCP